MQPPGDTNYAAESGVTTLIQYLRRSAISQLVALVLGPTILTAVVAPELVPRLWEAHDDPALAAYGGILRAMAVLHVLVAVTTLLSIAVVLWRRAVSSTWRHAVRFLAVPVLLAALMWCSIAGLFLTVRSEGVRTAAVGSVPVVVS